MAHTLYELKPSFQAWLRPLVGRLAALGLTANQVTIAALIASIAIGATVAIGAAISGAFWLFLLMPAWLPVRMAMNAIDGMLAREFLQQSALGAYLNELADVVSDAALYVPFAFVPPFGPWSVGTVIFASCLAELAGVAAALVGAARRHDGPLGKSDRAFVFGALGLYVGLDGPLPPAVFWLLPALALGIGWSVVNRVRRGAAAARISR